jgi:hypothetical protein
MITKKTIKDLISLDKSCQDQAKTVYVSRLEKASELNKKLKYLLKELDKQTNASDCCYFDSKEVKNIF